MLLLIRISSRHFSLHSTGLAGLINTIQMYSRGSIVAGVLGTITSVGWILQGAGIGFFYRQVGTTAPDCPFPTHMALRSGHIILLLATLSPRYSFPSPVFQLLTCFLQARSELAQHGAKAYFTRG